MEEENGLTTKKAYDIDCKDAFWSANAGLPFPQVAENVDQDLNKYKTEMSKVTSHLSGSDPTRTET